MGDFTAEINAFGKDTWGLNLGYSKPSWSVVARKNCWVNCEGKDTLTKNCKNMACNALLPLNIPRD